MKRLGLAFGTALAGTAVLSAVLISAGWAGDKPMSTIRRAAIEKLQSKLGTIRGSIKPKERNVLLTEYMIEQLTPVRPSYFTTASVTTRSDKIGELATANTLPDFEYLKDFAPGNTKTAESIWKLKTADGQPKTESAQISSRQQPSLPNTEDMKTLLQAVDRMVERES